MDKNLRDFSLSELETYGAGIQNEISESIDSMLQGVKCIDLGKTGTYMTDLSVLSGKTVKSLNQNKLTRFLVKPAKWVARYDYIENRLCSLGDSIEQEREKLDAVLNGLQQNREILSDKVTKLESVQCDLREYIEELKSNMGEADNGLRLQTAVNRLKVITTTIAVTKQEIAKTGLIIQENKEITTQLTDAYTNLIPMFKTMLMNTLAARANSEALKLKKSLVQTANRLVVDNARQIEETTMELLAGRTESLISVESITEANEILQRTVQAVVTSAQTETDVNLELIQSLEKSFTSVQSLSCTEGIETAEEI